MKEQAKNKPGKNGNFPPIEKGFKKGQSGNPSGRPPGARNRSTILREILDMNLNYENPFSGKMEKHSVEKQIEFQIVADVLQERNLSAYKEIKDTLYGKLNSTSESNLEEIKTDWDLLHKEFDEAMKKRAEANQYFTEKQKGKI